MKQEVLEHLRKSSIIQLACERAGVARATYYKWMNSDKHFAEESAVAISEGRTLVNDMAESQLIKKIKDGAMTAIVFWLKHHHGTYADSRWRYTDESNPLENRLPDYMLEEISRALHNAGLAGVFKLEEEIRKCEEAKQKSGENNKHPT